MPGVHVAGAAPFSVAAPAGEAVASAGAGKLRQVSYSSMESISRMRKEAI